METESTMARRSNSNNDEQLTEQTRERPLVTPPVDIYENGDELLLVADMPGVARESITIDLNKDRLTVTGRREGVIMGGGRGEATPEFDYYRAFVVPNGLDAEKITAELSAGVLRVHLPKSAALKPRRIEVRAG